MTTSISNLTTTAIQYTVSCGPLTTRPLVPTYFICPKECEKHSNECVLTNKAKQFGGQGTTPGGSDGGNGGGNNGSGSGSDIIIDNLPCPTIERIAHLSMRGGQLMMITEKGGDKARQFIVAAYPQSSVACCVLTTENVSLVK